MGSVFEDSAVPTDGDEGGGAAEAGLDQAERFDFRQHATKAKEQYEPIYPIYEEFARVIEAIIRTCLSNSDIKTHTISGRPKSVEGLYQKALKESDENPNSPRYPNPLAQITDLAGVRVITYFLKTVDEVDRVIHGEFDVIERVDKSEAFEKEQRLGYQSLHLLVKLKQNRCILPEYAKFSGLTAEIQVRTILQHAWAEIEHDIQYKAVYTLPLQTKRRFMALAGALEIADREFQAIAKTDEKLRSEALRSVAEDRLSEVEITPEALKAYLDKEYGADGRMSNWSYSYAVRLLKSLGFSSLGEVDSFVSGIDDDKLSRQLHGSRQGQLTRFENVLLVAAGDEYLRRHPWGNNPGNEWFVDSINALLNKACDKEIEVGQRTLPQRRPEA